MEASLRERHQVLNPYNPYAAPVQAPVQAPQGTFAPGEPAPWDVGEVIRLGWEAYKGTWAPLTFGFFVVGLLGMLPGQVATVLVATGQLTSGTRTYWAVHIPLSIIGWVMGEFFGAGLTRAALTATRTTQASFGQFFTGPRFLSFLGMSFLRTLAVVLGVALLVVPGIILSLGFANAPFYVVDQGLGPIAALKASWESAEGQKGNLFVLALAETGLMLVGLAACCLGFFVVVPIMVLARSFAYMRMSGAIHANPVG